MNCAFCGSHETLTKEHLFSTPICNALGVDRSMLVASLDEKAGAIGTPIRLDQRQVRLPCGPCNSGWMSHLEIDAANAMKRWIAGDQRLTRMGFNLVTRWLVKTAIVLGFSEADARRFLDSPLDTAIPDVTAAKRIAAGELPDHVVAGAARTAPSTYIWGVGNPTVQPVGPQNISSRAINVAALNLGTLQLWVVIPMIKPVAVRLPRQVTRLNPHVRAAHLSTRVERLNPTDVEVTYPGAEAA